MEMRTNSGAVCGVPGVTCSWEGNEIGSFWKKIKRKKLMRKKLF